MKGVSCDVVLARTREGNQSMKTRLAKLGIDSVSVETIRLEEPEDWTELDGAIMGIKRFDWVAFTSPKGVAIFGKRLGKLSLGVRGVGPRFAVVGTKTESALKELGIEADYIPSEFLTSALGRGLPKGHGSRVLLLRADIAGKDLVKLLKGRGFEVTDVAAYRTRYVEGQLDTGELRTARVIAFASPSEVAGFRRRLGGPAFRDIAARATAACIGPVTARAAKDAGFRNVVFASEHTIEGLTEKVGEMLVHA